MYLCDSTEVLRQKICDIEEAQDFIFRPVFKPLRADSTKCQSSPIHTAHFHRIYKSLRQRVLSCKGIKVIWNEFSTYNPRSFLEYLQLISEKTDKTLTSSAFAAHPIHVVLLKKSTVKI